MQGTSHKCISRWSSVIHSLLLAAALSRAVGRGPGGVNLRGKDANTRDESQKSLAWSIFNSESTSWVGTMHVDTSCEAEDRWYLRILEDNVDLF